MRVADRRFFCRFAALTIYNLTSPEKCEEGYVPKIYLVHLVNAFGLDYCMTPFGSDPLVSIFLVYSQLVAFDDSFNHRFR